MLKNKWISLAGLLAAFFVVGCQNGPKPQAEASPAFQDRTAELQAELADARARLAAAPGPAQLAAANDDLARRDLLLAQKDADLAAKDAEIARLSEGLRRQEPAALSRATPGLEGIATTYDAKAGTVTVNLPGDILFAPGQDALKSSARSTLDKIVAAIRRQYPGKTLFVDGYTDTDPIRAHKEDYDDNRDLSYARAKAVTNYLTDHGIAGKQIAVRAFGEFRPKATKAASRRVEIVVVAE